MSDASSSELLDLAQRVAGAGRAGEEVEAYVVRSRETEVRVFDGDVESLSMAGVEGVGVRVISDHRQGFAWAGSLETAVVDETLDEARDNAAFGEPDEWNGLPSPSDFEAVTPAPLEDALEWMVSVGAAWDERLQALRSSLARQGKSRSTRQPPSAPRS